MKNGTYLFAILFFICCNTQRKASSGVLTNQLGIYGRAVVTNEKVELIGAASYIEFMFTGETCTVDMMHKAPGNNYGFVSLEIDNQFIQRIKIAGDTIRQYAIKATRNTEHVVRLYKATESANGQIIVAAVNAEKLKRAPHPTKKKIEFIGNSITSGMGIDWKEIPCHTGQWYDQHNAYWAYGPSVARQLNADFMLSSVSGIGMYRTWNTESPSMPMVYESLHLNKDEKERWNFSQFIPDVVSLCLGTNDLSDGDGKTARQPFDSTVFVNAYVNFIGAIYKYYPGTQIALLTSPMVSGKKGALLLSCLQAIRDKSSQVYPGNKRAAIFEFQPMVPKGCDYHPDKDDHAKLAEEVKGFFEQLLKQ